MAHASLTIHWCCATTDSREERRREISVPSMGAAVEERGCGVFTGEEEDGDEG